MAKVKENSISPAIIEAPPNYEMFPTYRRPNSCLIILKKNFICLIIGLLIILAGFISFFVTFTIMKENYEEATTLASTTTTELITTTTTIAKARGPNLFKGECLSRNDAIISDKNCFRLILQVDGNMVIYRQSDSAVVWASGTNRKGGFKACMQHDGNFVISDVNNRPLWAPNTNEKGGHYVHLQNDGQVTVKGSNGESVWVSGKLMGC